MRFQIIDWINLYKEHDFLSVNKLFYLIAINYI